MSNIKVSYSTAASEMRQNGSKIHQWAQQNDNLLLKACAIEVLEVYKQGGGA